MDANLKRELPMSIQEALDRQLAIGEKLLISLPGSFGEAIAVSERRAFVVRDCDSGLEAKCNVFGYPLGSLDGAQVVSSGTGGYIELKLKEPVSDPDQARVYFPSYDAAVFQPAADAITKLVTAAPQAAAPAQETGAAVPGGSNCPKCGARVEERVPFCSQCGEQIRTICPECSESSPVASIYCRGCGRKMEPYSPACPSCGARVLRWMSFCTECGSNLQQKCLACGMNVVSGWKYCASCGRLLGSDRLDPAAVRAAQRRLQEVKAMEEEGRAAPAQAELQPAPAVSSTATAEDHNKRGRELFENGDNEGAINAFKMAVQLEPGNASYHCNLGVAYDENEQDDLAFEEYTKTLEIDPNDLTALLSLGYMYSENEEVDKAQAVWNKVIQISPNSAEAEEARDNLRHQQEL